MNFGIGRLLCFSLCCVSALWGFQQSIPEARRLEKMAVTNVGSLSGVSIKAKLANERDFPIVVQFCGKRQNRYEICMPPVSVEQFDGSAWKRVEPTPEHMFGTRSTTLPFVTIEPHAAIDVDAGFPTEVFQWKPDQPVRMVISAWPASDKALLPENEIQYTTGNLEPPSSGDTAFQQQQPGNLQIAELDKQRGAVIAVEIMNELGFDISIPTCGKSEPDAKYEVCLPPAFFEQYDGTKWRRVKLTSVNRSGEPAETAWVTLAPHKSTKISVVFPPEAYKWINGRMVRLVIPEQHNAVQYVTDPLEPPSDGSMAFEPYENQNLM